MCFSPSILNKLTPEKFDKLCLELLNVGVESKLILKGVILLVSLKCTSFLHLITALNHERSWIRICVSE